MFKFEELQSSPIFWIVIGILIFLLLWWAYNTWDNHPKTFCALYTLGLIGSFSYGLYSKTIILNIPGQT